MNTKISIALAIYNGELYLEEQLKSIVLQELLPFEIIIVDDCSSDNSENIIKSFDFGPVKCRYYKNENNLGPIANFKKAIGLCTGDYIALCDQDDIWLPEKIKTLYNEIITKNNSKPVVCYSDVSLMDSNATILTASIRKDVWKIKPHKYPFSLLLIDNVIIGCTTLINREMQNEISKMPVKIMMHDHWIALIGSTIGSSCFIDKPLILYRSHTGSVTQKVPPKGFIGKIRFELKVRGSYLRENMQQAQQFKNVYYNELSHKDKKTLDSFFSIVKKPYLIKRIYTKLLKKYINI